MQQDVQNIQMFSNILENSIIDSYYNINNPNICFLLVKVGVK